MNFQYSYSFPEVYIDDDQTNPSFLHSFIGQINSSTLFSKDFKYEKKKTNQTKKTKYRPLLNPPKKSQPESGLF